MKKKHKKSFNRFIEIIKNIFMRKHKSRRTKKMIKDYEVTTTRVYIVQSEKEMLSLNAKIGSMAIIRLINDYECFILRELPSNKLENWTAMYYSLFEYPETKNSNKNNIDDDDTDYYDCDNYGSVWSELDGKQSKLDKYSLEDMQDWYESEIQDFKDDYY